MNTRCNYRKLFAAVASGILLASGVAEAAPGYAKCGATRPAEFDGTIVDAAVATPELSTLVSLVTAADLVDALNGPGPLTVYAPTNAAFGKIPADVLGAIGADTKVLTSVLTYHVSAGLKDPRRPKTPREVPTLNGQSVFFDYDGGPQINQSTASCKAVKTSNGIVWIIDSVLLPQFK